MRHVLGVILVFTGLACGDDSEGLLHGSVSSVIYEPSPGWTWYRGQIQVTGTEVGTIATYIRADMLITVRTPSGKTVSGTLSSFTVGDAIFLWYQKNGPIAASYPPIYPVTRIEIHK